jgi:hypothetical protein
VRPADDGHLLLSALGVLAWLAWFVFDQRPAQAVAVIRGLPTLPLLGSVQRPAAALVAAPRSCSANRSHHGGSAAGESGAHGGGVHDVARVERAGIHEAARH